MLALRTARLKDLLPALPTLPAPELVQRTAAGFAARAFGISALLAAPAGVLKPATLTSAKTEFAVENRQAKIMISNWDGPMLALLLLAICFLLSPPPDLGPEGPVLLGGGGVCLHALMHCLHRLTSACNRKIKTALITGVGVLGPPLLFGLWLLLLCLERHIVIVGRLNEVLNPLCRSGSGGLLKDSDPKSIALLYSSRRN